MDCCELVQISIVTLLNFIDRVNNIIWNDFLRYYAV